MPQTYVPAPFRIQIYRGIYYDYEQGKVITSSVSQNCKCACENACNGVDSLLYREHVPPPPSKLTSADSSACILCKSITTALEPSTLLAEMKFNLPYDTLYNTSQAAILQKISDIEKKQQQFELNRTKIRSLQSRIRLAHELLNAQATKLKTIGSAFADLRAQTSEKHLDRVAFRFPYAQPFYTMSSRNYMLLLLCFNICLVVVILVYGFRKRTTLVADMATPTPTPTSGSPNAAATTQPPESESGYRSNPSASQPRRSTTDERDFDEW
jgi:hypothetical protein